MTVERLADVCPTLAEALADYLSAVLGDDDNETLVALGRRLEMIAESFREGAAFALGTTPADVPEMLHRALNA